MIRKIITGFSLIGTLPIRFFKSGCSIVILALASIYFHCESELAMGSVGVELYYAPMLDYILTALLIFWGGTFILDLAEKELKK